MPHQSSEPVEMMNVIYESVAALPGHDPCVQSEDADGAMKLRPQCTDVQPPLRPDSTGRRSRMTAVFVLMLCVLLLTVITTLLLKVNNLMIENSQLQTRYNNLINQMEQKDDELQTSSEGHMDTAGWICFNSSMYYISTEPNSWNSSNKNCKERGADLVIINSQEEQDFINFFRRSNKVWIGMNDRETEGEWKWVDGSDLTFSYWKSNEPNGQRKENCAITEGQWSDYSCVEQFSCICEKRILTEKTPKTINYCLIIRSWTVRW